MESILEFVNDWSKNSHNYENENFSAVSFEKEIVEQFTQSVRKWFSSLKPSYREAIKALGFNRTVLTSLMFFGYYNSLEWEYKKLTTKIVSYLTADDIIAHYKKNWNDLPYELLGAFHAYGDIREMRKKIADENGSILNKLSPDLKDKVIVELLEQDELYKYRVKNLEKELSNYRKAILHEAINRVIKEIESEG